MVLEEDCLDRALVLSDRSGAGLEAIVGLLKSLVEKRSTDRDARGVVRFRHLLTALVLRPK